MSIDVSIRRDGIGEFLARFPTRAARLSAELCDIGREIASYAFGSAMYDGVNDITVELQATDRGCRVVANGNAVCFVEFGAGVYYGGNYLGRRPPEILGIGQYGRHNGMRNTWSYYGSPGTNGELAMHKKSGDTVVITHGNPPANAMAMAVVQMRDKLVETAREVFSND